MKREKQFAAAWREAHEDGVTLQEHMRRYGKSEDALLERKALVEGKVGEKLPPLIDERDSSPQVLALQRKLASVNRENRILRQRTSSDDEIKRLILKLDGMIDDTETPEWVAAEPSAGKKRGTPTLFLSDLHWGEMVDPKQINGLNSFDLPIAHRRLEHTFQTALRLAFDEFANPDWPGIVIPLGGDMLSGNIHDEIRENNEAQVLECVDDLYHHLCAGIDMMRGHFPKVFLPCVVGNHGRLDRKPRMKGGVKDNFEWLLYRMLQRRYLNDDAVDVRVSDSFDFLYRVHGYRYMLTHGDSFKGGGGITGPLLPWARGDQKKRRLYEAHGAGYDTLLMGHWHSLAYLGPRDKVIVNGSLKGFDEYAFKMAFEYEPAQQAMWITHPRHGITYRMGIIADHTSTDEKKAGSWVEVMA